MIQPDNIRVGFTPYSLIFKEPGGTSRGVLREKPTYFLRVESLESGQAAFGEVPFFPGLSRETQNEVEEGLKRLSMIRKFDDLHRFSGISSIDFGLQQVVAELENTDFIFPSDFTKGTSAIPINGLIWMGTFDRMVQRVYEKLNAGFRCIKLKIGSIDWNSELDLIRLIRDKVGYDVTIRVDANGAFSEDECLTKLEQLARLSVHSIEQPIKSDNLHAMRKICCESPIPVALDEELIGIPIDDSRSQMLEYVRPQYIILKPALCFGFRGASDWIERAGRLGIGWWVTSALESSVGLNAIAQYTGSLAPDMFQGLGTGALFTNNFPSPLLLEGEELSFEGPSGVYNPALEGLNWIYG